MGNIRKSLLLVIVLATIIVWGCGPINGQLDAKGGEHTPTFKSTENLEYKDIYRTHYIIDATGEQNAREMVADSFRRLNDPYKAIIVKVTDENDQSWYGLYVHNENVLYDIKGTKSDERTKEEIALENYISRSKHLSYPVIRFSEEPILEDLDF